MLASRINTPVAFSSVWYSQLSLAPKALSMEDIKPLLEQETDESAIRNQAGRNFKTRWIADGQGWMHALLNNLDPLTEGIYFNANQSISCLAADPSKAKASDRTVKLFRTEVRKRFSESLKNLALTDQFKGKLYALLSPRDGSTYRFAVVDELDNPACNALKGLELKAVLDTIRDLGLNRLKPKSGSFWAVFGNAFLKKQGELSVTEENLPRLQAEIVQAMQPRKDSAANPKKPKAC